MISAGNCSCSPLPGGGRLRELCLYSAAPLGSLGKTLSTSFQASLSPIFNRAVQEDRIRRLIRGLFTVSILILQRKTGDDFFS